MCPRFVLLLKNCCRQNIFINDSVGNSTLCMKHMAALLVLLLFAAVQFTTAVSAVHYVVADGSQYCPTGQTCHNLSYYVSQPDHYFTSDTEFIFLEGKHKLKRDEAVMVSEVNNLTLRGEGNWVEGPEETVMQSSVIIYCSEGKGGFSFFNSYTIRIEELTFINCGASATISITNITDFALFHVSVQNSTMIGLMAINCSKVQVHYSSFTYSCTIKMRNQSICGVLNICSNARFYYSSHEAQLTVSHSNFTKGCSFQGGGVSIETSECVLSVVMSNLIFQQNSALRGGGMGLLVKWRSTVTLWITDSKFYENVALPEGGGMIIEINGSCSHANITVQNTKLVNNSGYYGGELGIYTYNISNDAFFYLLDSQIINQKSTHFGIFIDKWSLNGMILIRNTTMNFEGYTWFAIYIKAVIALSTITPVRFEDSTFDWNTNRYSVVGVYGVSALISNCTFSNNHNGVVVITFADYLGTIFIKNCTITDNNMTGLLVKSGDVSFSGHNVIHNNKNTKGAGIYLSAYSDIIIDGTLVLYNNTATVVGGALLQETPPIGNRIITDTDWMCTMSFDQPNHNSKVIFSGNRAKEGGSDIYGTRLMNCKYGDYNQYIHGIGTPNETSWYFETPLSKYLQFSNTDKLSSMSSDPIMVCFCNNSYLPDCTKRTHHHADAYPGEEIVTTIATVGYYGGTSSGTVEIQVHNATLARPYGPQGTTTTCSNLHLLLKSIPPTSALVDITVIGGLPGWGVSVSVDIKECPPGFYEGPKSVCCQCAPQLHSYNITCNSSRNPFQFQRSGNNWFAYLNSSSKIRFWFNTTDCLFTFTNCPFDYCSHSLVSFNIVHPERQCTGNRTGILCGQCQPGLSLMLGSNRCAHCSNIYLLLLLPFALAGIALVAALMALNLTVSDGAINGLLFYANMIKLNEAFFFPKGSVPVISQFISWLNLDLGIEGCFFDGLDGYWKTWLQFSFPAYLFLLMLAIILGCQYSVWLCRLCGSHTVPALATLFLMSYTKILRTVTNALSISWLECNGRVLRVWSVDGNVPYSLEKHIPLLIFSSCVLVAGVAYPLLVLCAPLLERYSDKCFPWRWNPVPRLKPLLDAYGGPYKDSYRFWTGVTLMVRLIITVILSFTSGDLSYINTYIITAVVLGFLTVWFLFKGVYKTMYRNVLDLIFLLNLAVLSNTSAAFFQSQSSYYQQVAAITSVSLSFAAFISIVMLHLWWNFDLNRMKRKFGMEHEVLQVAVERREEEGDGIQHPPGSPPSRVYSSRRGEHQFELFFPDSSYPGNSGRIDDYPDQSSPILLEREPLLFRNDQD